MPLLIALVALVAVLALGVMLGVLGLMRRPFRAPVWLPVFAFPLALRAVVLTFALALAFAFTAWRHPEALDGLSIGLGVGVVLGVGAGVAAKLRREGRWMQQRPNRAYVVLLAVAVLARAALAAAGGLADLPEAMRGTLPMLGGLLGGYPLAHAIVLRTRLRRFLRLHDGVDPRIVVTSRRETDR